MPARPLRIVPFPNGEIGVVWDDGHESYLDSYALRCACGCASCVDEATGRKLLRDERVPRDVRAREIHPVGNYGVAIVWSDGHDTGIYTFDRLREL
jgi:DUF971 family protein